MSEALPPPTDPTEPRLEVAILTGMSGAGRTQAAKVLEDLGFFVIDNLPPQLITRVVELARAPGSSLDRLALVADVRGREFFSELQTTIRELRGDAGANVRVLFLTAADDELVARFEATRRRHPMGGDEGVADGIAKERDLLSELRGDADLVIDTTDLNVHELRDRVVDAFATDGQATLQVAVVSFGFKHGLPRDADLVFDVRFLPNPHWIEELRPHTGLDEPVRQYVLGQPPTEQFLEQLYGLLDATLPGYEDEGKRYLTIAIGCTGGKHRSVAIAERVGARLRETTDLPVHVDHRDLGRE